MGVVAMRMRWSLVVLVVGCVGVVGCTSDGGSATRPSGAASSGASSSGAAATSAPETSTAPETSAALVPSGIRAIAWGFEDALRVVTDGNGVVWASGPDSITRYDPADGRASTWDVADDIAFAATRGIAPAARGGVWLLSASRLRLFDGQRFARVIEVPAAYRADPQFPLADLVEQGDAVWVTNDHDVTARWQRGTWTRAAEPQGGPLAVDGAGALWAGGRTYPGPTHGVYGVARWDAATWTRPGDGSPSMPSVEDVVDLASDGRTGAWLLTRTSTDSGPSPAWLWHWDGRAWSRASVPAAIGEVGGDTVLTGAPDGAAWVAGAAGFARYSTATGWTVTGPRLGLPAGTDNAFTRGVAVSGTDVYAMASSGLYRVHGGRAARVWTPARPGPTGVNAVVAVSADEVWAEALPTSTTTSASWWRWHDGRWGRIALPPGPVTADSPPGAGGAIASDGAVWLGTAAGLVRVVEERAAVVSRSASPYVTPVAGPDGSVYTVEGRGRVVRVRPDGTLTNLGAPSGGGSSPEGDDVRSLAVAPDGSLWAASSGFGPQRLWRWQGSWQDVDVPDGVTQVTGMVVASDGHLWLAGYAQGLGRLARYDSGAWTTLPAAMPWGLAAGPDGVVCASDAATCYPATYPAAFPALGTSRSYLPDAWAIAIGVAPDGAVWVLGHTLLRVTR